VNNCPLTSSLQTSTPAPQRLTLSLLVLPGVVTFIVTLITLIFTTIIFNSHNKGDCDPSLGFYPGYEMICTRELAACQVVHYFADTYWEDRDSACGGTQTGRHLVAPLFVASVLILGLGIARLFVERKRQNEYIGSADERVQRLQREEE
jgi:hypothetical protein